MRQLDFIGVGVGRSGTTWTWEQLTKHPDVCVPQDTKKEAKIFFKQHNEIPGALLRYNECPKRKFIGEYTPVYFQEVPAKKVKIYCPKAKIITIFRNPIERIFTQYKAQQWRRYREPVDSFLSWFKSQEADNMWTVHGNSYMRWLPEWHNEFGNQLYINFFDDLKADPLSFIRGIFSQIGLSDFIPPHWQEKEVKPYNEYYEQNPIEFTKKEKKFVRSYYRDGIREMENFVGVDLSHWLEL